MGQTKIPVDVTFEHYLAVKGILQHVLEDIEATVGRAPKWISCRLNKSGATAPKPYFLGWVENEALRTIRVKSKNPDPGLFRFLDDVEADTYSNSLKDPAHVKRQYWRVLPARKPNPPLKEELYLYLPRGHFKLPKNYEVCRLSVAIKANKCYAGTLNIGLTRDPGSALNRKMKEWGQSSTSELVQYVKNEFSLGGPTL